MTTPIKLNLPASSSVADPQTRQEITLLYNQIKVLTETANSLMKELEEVKGKLNGS